MLVYILIGAIIFVGGLIVAILVLRRLKPKAEGGKKKITADKSLIILESIGDGVAQIDLEGIIQTFNPAAANITGWPIEEAIGIDYRSVLPLLNQKDEPYADEQNPFYKVLKSNEQTKDTVAVLKTRSDKRAGLSIIVSPLHAPDGKLIGAVGVFRDVSQERNEEKQRAEFISTASHEMRTPVAAIEGYLALAMNDKVCHTDAKAKDFLEKAHASTQHLGKLFQDLLTAAKSEDGRLSNHPGVIEMAAYLQEIASDVKFSAEKKGLFLEFVIGMSGNTVDARANRVVKPLYYVYADSERLREVITNLFDNAVKYTETGKITIGLTGDASVVQIRITDTGPGIPPEDVPHLFQKFYRVDNSATRTVGGTGLGLFICRKIVELYNGAIWVDSTVGQGSTFYINLPRLSNERASQLSQQAAAVASPLNT